MCLSSPFVDPSGGRHEEHWLRGGTNSITQSPSVNTYHDQGQGQSHLQGRRGVSHSGISAAGRRQHARHLLLRGERDRPTLPDRTTWRNTNVGFGYASFLLGLADGAAISRPTNPRMGKKSSGLYAQDSWKITRKLTLDYGLRYDYSTVPEGDSRARAGFLTHDAEPAVRAAFWGRPSTKAAARAIAIAASPIIIGLPSGRGWVSPIKSTPRPCSAAALELFMAARP